MNIVIINCFDTYEKRVDLIYDFFKRKGDNVKVYTSNFRHVSKSVRADKKENYKLIPVKVYKKNLSLARIQSHEHFSEDVFAEIEGSKIDVLWVLMPPNSLGKRAYDYALKNKVKLVFDVIDMWPETMPVVGKMKRLQPFTIWKNKRDNYLNKADMVVTECELYQDVLAACVDKERMDTLYWAQQESKCELRYDLNPDIIELCYLGSINNIIDIPMIAKLIRTMDKKVVLHIIGNGEKREELIRQAKLAGAEVIYHGEIYDETEKMRIYEKCLFGLNVMKPSVFVGLTMKSLDYWAHGLPILNTIGGDTRRIVNENFMGINISAEMGEDINGDTLKTFYSETARANVRQAYTRIFGIQAFENKMSKIYENLR